MCQQSDIVHIICHQYQRQQGKFAAGVIDTNCHKYQQHQRYWWQNLLLVLLIAVVHVDLGISPRIVFKNLK
jgi:hypothetical protein